MLNSSRFKIHWKWFVENVLGFLFAIVVVFAIRSSFIEAFKVPTGSMLPTIFIGDNIFANKFAYGLKIPFSDLITNNPIYLIERAPPKLGDVIVFLNPKNESIYFIKRVIGVPNDVIEIRNKVLYINQKPMLHRKVNLEASTALLKSLNDSRYTPSYIDVLEEDLNGRKHAILLDRTNYLGDNFGPITVPSESLFVMGDNRDFSNDSRFWGFVPFKNVKGAALFVWLSFTMDFEKKDFSFRPSRTGTILQPSTPANLVAY